MTNELICPFCGCAITENLAGDWRCANVSCWEKHGTAKKEIWQAVIDGKKAQESLKRASVILGKAIDHATTQWFPSIMPDTPEDHEARKVIYAVLEKTLTQIREQED